MFPELTFYEIVLNSELTVDLLTTYLLPGSIAGEKVKSHPCPQVALSCVWMFSDKEKREPTVARTWVGEHRPTCGWVQPKVMGEPLKDSVIHTEPPGLALSLSCLVYLVNG